MFIDSDECDFVAQTSLGTFEAVILLCLPVCLSLSKHFMYKCMYTYTYFLYESPSLSFFLQMMGLMERLRRSLVRSRPPCPPEDTVTHVRLLVCPSFCHLLILQPHVSKANPLYYHYNEIKKCF